MVLPRMVWCGNDPLLAGATQVGMANVGLAANANVWSLYYNPASLAGIKQWQAGIYYENKFLLKQTALKSVALSTPLLKGNIAAGYTHYGYDLYNEQQFSLAYSRYIHSSIAVGLQFNYRMLNIAESYGSTGNIIAGIGLLAHLSDKLSMGAYTYNPHRAKRSTNEYYPTFLGVGMSYNFSEQVTLSADVCKNSTDKPNVKVGVQYNPYDNITLRAGVASGGNTQFSFGFGIKLKQIVINIAAQYQPVLGFSPSAEVNYISEN